jgi:gas vesicle protein
MATNQNHHIKKQTMNNATAGAVGAVVGGMVGAAAGIALSDKQRRKMIMQKVDDLKKYVGRALDEIQVMSEDTTDLISEGPTAKKRTKKTRSTTSKHTSTQKKQVN